MTTSETKKPFFVHCGNCSHEWVAAFLPMPVDVFAKLAMAPLCPMCGSNNVLIGALPKEAAHGDPVAWLTSGDTGVSSKTIWGILMGRDAGVSEFRGIPHDPSDFGRCYRLLKIMPSWRARLPEVSARFPEWGPLVRAWGELTALYEEELPTGRCPKLYQRMQDLRALEDQSGNPRNRAGAK